MVVEDDLLFASGYPNVILVPLADDERLAIPELAVVIEPTAENGCTKRCWALSHCVATTSGSRLKGTASSITKEQLSRIRKQIAFAIGADDQLR